MWHALCRHADTVKVCEDVASVWSALCRQTLSKYVKVQHLYGLLCAGGHCQSLWRCSLCVACFVQTDTVKVCEGVATMQPALCRWTLSKYVKVQHLYGLLCAGGHCQSMWRCSTYMACFVQADTVKVCEDVASAWPALCRQTLSKSVKVWPLCSLLCADGHCQSLWRCSLCVACFVQTDTVKVCEGAATMQPALCRWTLSKYVKVQHLYGLLCADGQSVKV